MVDTEGAGAAGVNDSVDSTVLPPVVTAILPGLALAGTFTVSWVAEAETTSAVFPPNFTTLEAGEVENPVPASVSVPPAGARTGTAERIDSALEAYLSIPRRFPVASYR